MSEIECEAEWQFLDRGSATIGDDDRLGQVQPTLAGIVTDDATSLGKAMANSVVKGEVPRALGVPQRCVTALKMEEIPGHTIC